MNLEAPFPGLVPFEESDAPLFHGRKDEARVISANLHAARLTLLFGESGAGKSSLLNAERRRRGPHPRPNGG
jgi:predicted GTPase